MEPGLREPGCAGFRHATGRSARLYPGNGARRRDGKCVRDFVPGRRQSDGTATGTECHASDADVQHPDLWPHSGDPRSRSVRRREWLAHGTLDVSDGLIHVLHGDPFIPEPATLFMVLPALGWLARKRFLAAARISSRDGLPPAA